MIGCITGLNLPSSVLKLRSELPLKPSSVTLEGEYVYLKPLDLTRDVVALFEVSNGMPITFNDREFGAYDSNLLIWQYMSGGPFANAKELEAFLQPQILAENGLCFCVFDNNTGKQIGVTNYMNNFPVHLKIELGSIWYSPVAQRTKVNLETTYLMLKHAFALGYRRIEWKCDSLNERSCRSALRLGFKTEGVQESHLIVKDRNRDSAWFRILDSEWETVKLNLETLLGS